MSSGSTYPAFFVVDSEGRATWLILAMILIYFGFVLCVVFNQSSSSILSLILYYTFVLFYFVFCIVFSIVICVPI